MADTSADLAEIAGLVEAAIERLDELVFRELRDAVGRGDAKRPEIERRMTRARNALRRALPLLHEDGAAP